MSFDQSLHLTLVTPSKKFTHTHTDSQFQLIAVSAGRWLCCMAKHSNGSGWLALRQFWSISAVIGHGCLIFSVVVGFLCMSSCVNQLTAKPWSLSLVLTARAQYPEARSLGQGSGVPKEARLPPIICALHFGMGRSKAKSAHASAATWTWMIFVYILDGNDEEFGSLAVVFIHGWSHGVYLTIPRVWIGALSIWTLCY